MADSSAAAAARKFLRRKLFTQLPQQESKQERYSIPKLSTTESREDARREVKDMLQHTILKGEGNSLLIVGPRLCGKTYLLNEVLNELSSDSRCHGNFQLVKLNGAIHTDDHLALQAIAWQLGQDTHMEDRVTLAFSVALDCILQALRSGSSQNQSIVFILEEFDLFTKHKKQTLLYNLFDLAQSSLNPIAVVGVTCKETVAEVLEKRVQSRFSRRYVAIRNDYSFKLYVMIFQELLQLPSDFDDQTYLKRWNDSLKDLVANAEVVAFLKFLHSTYCNIHSLKLFLTTPVCKLSEQHPFITTQDITCSMSVLSADYTVCQIQGLSSLELCMVIAATQIVCVNGYQEPFNFEMVYNEYKRFTQRSNSIQFFNKEVAMKAFENLVYYNVICPSDGCDRASVKTMKQFKLMKLNVLIDQVKEAVKNYSNCPTDVTRWMDTLPRGVV